MLTVDLVFDNAVLEADALLWSRNSTAQ